MKKNQFWKTVLVLTVTIFSVGFFSCKDDDDDKKGGEESATITENDPEGTIIANLNNNANHERWGYISNGLTIFNLRGFIDDFVDYDIDLGINNANNFIIGADIDSSIGRIINVGKVKGLAGIKTIPETGWSEELAVIPRNGYILSGEASYGDYSKQYARIYVVDYITSTSGGIIGATIKYQPNWNPDENDEK